MRLMFARTFDLMRLQIRSVSLRGLMGFGLNEALSSGEVSPVTSRCLLFVVPAMKYFQEFLLDRDRHATLARIDHMLSVPPYQSPLAISAKNYKL